MSSISNEDLSDSSDESRRATPLPLPNLKKRKTSAKHMPIMIPGSEPYHKCRKPGCSKLSRTYYELCGVFLCLNTNRNCFAEFHK